MRHLYRRAHQRNVVLDESTSGASCCAGWLGIRCVHSHIMVYLLTKVLCIESGHRQPKAQAAHAVRAAQAAAAVKSSEGVRRTGVRVLVRSRIACRAHALHIVPMSSMVH